MDWTCFELPHNRIHSWGFRYKNFALVTDYDNLTQQVLDCLHGLDLLLLECNNGMQQVRNGQQLDKNTALSGAITASKNHFDASFGKS